MEVEKALSGSTGQSLDGGTSAGQLGHLLTWLQERNSEAILVATSNDITLLPPEFLRAGRWDAMFFVGFPNVSERKSIISIMNRKWGSELPETDEFAAKLDKFSGAEIEQVAKDSHFYENLDEVIKKVPRIWDSKREVVERIMKFGATIRNASKVDKVDTVQPSKAKRTVCMDDASNLEDLKKKLAKDFLK
jgi:SpoVK/Ycf46/Vps4 family AAA+-type ATPase